MLSAETEFPTFAILMVLYACTISSTRVFSGGFYFLQKFPHTSSWIMHGLKGVRFHMILVDLGSFCCIRWFLDGRAAPALL